MNEQTKQINEIKIKLCQHRKLLSKVTIVGKYQSDTKIRVTIQWYKCAIHIL